MIEARLRALAATLTELRERIKGIRRRGERIGEQNTKAVLIEPLLSVLGWNLLDLSEVIREHRQNPQDSPVDYALFIAGSPSLFVEAKDLGSDLGDRKWVSQILGYATVVGVEWCVLTNGDEYRLYNSHAPVGVEEKLFRAVRISDSSQEEYTLGTVDLLSKDNMAQKRIDALWKAHFVDRHVKTALQDLLTSHNRTLIRWVHTRRPGLSSSDIRDSLTRANIQIEFPVVAPDLPASGAGRSSRRRRPKTTGLRLLDLIEAGLVSAPLQLERDYKGVRLTATIQADATVVVDGQPYRSLSTAGGMARRSVIGAPPDRPYPQTNGWTFWKYRDPETGDLMQIDVLRKRYAERNRGA